MPCTVKVLPLEVILQRGEFAWSDAWRAVREDLEAAVRGIVWPLGGRDFRINPKKNGNGVRPICNAFKSTLLARNPKWKKEWMCHAGLGSEVLPGVGKFDVALPVGGKHFVVEWETGNISSTHRSLNRITLGMIRGALVGGLVVIPSRKLYPYLTDRIGNIDEVRPYYPVYDRLRIDDGLLAMLPVEHDALDPSVPFMEKGLDGMAIHRADPSPDILQGSTFVASE